jgi:glycine C-acetyltransferase
VQVVKETKVALVRKRLRSPDEYICHKRQGNFVEIEQEAETGKRRTVLTFAPTMLWG